MKYIIRTKEVWIQDYEVEATSKEEAFANVFNTDVSSPIQSSFELSHVENEDTWQIVDY
jgi:hypothetical protein